MTFVVSIHNNRNQTADIPHYISEQDWEETSIAVIHMVRRTVLPPHRRMCVLAN